MGSVAPTATIDAPGRDMAIERTFGIVKPDAVAKNAIGGVIDMIEKAGLKLVGLRLIQLSEAQAHGFYAVHKARPFFRDW